MADGFLGRWSRRKLDVNERRLPEPEPGQHPEPADATPARDPAPAPAVRQEPAVVAPPAPPTLEEANALTPQSDFSSFTGRNVQPEVSNAAMKKLFGDPRFNVMDGLDVYIDDYSRPDPIPPEMLRKLASAQFLNLFGDEDKPESPAVAEGGDDADGPASADVAQSQVCNALPSQPEGPESPASPTEHADPDLRLQQDHAPPGKAPGRGAQ